MPKKKKKEKKKKKSISAPENGAALDHATWE
jgi:hypothetical protein